MRKFMPELSVDDLKAVRDALAVHICHIETGTGYLRRSDCEQDPLMLSKIKPLDDCQCDKVRRLERLASAFSMAVVDRTVG